MKLYAISDVHLNHAANRAALESLPPHPDDWLILAGDIGEQIGHLDLALRVLAPRFRQVVWVPGNHDLWTHPRDPRRERGAEKYRALVDVCRRHGALTPEDPYPHWEGEGPECILAPLFLLYDYSFRPDHVSRAKALEWALETDVMCVDEVLLHPDPHPTREAWCAARLEETSARLDEAARQKPLVLINHFPLRRDLVRLRRIPRFVLWCGTRRTEDWHLRYNAIVVVTGHLHVRATDWIDGVRFEEVSLGYPEHWRPDKGAASYLREILPGPAPPDGGATGTVWHR